MNSLNSTAADLGATPDRYWRGRPAQGEVASEVIQFSASILDAIENHFDARLVRENAGYYVGEIYTETHAALAESLLFMIRGPDAAFRLESARKLLQNWRSLGVELKADSPFDDFANCLNLFLLSKCEADRTPLGRLLMEICAAQRLPDVDPQVGNNIFLIRQVTVGILRPASLGQPVQDKAIVEVLGVLDRFRSIEGFYFDWPRDRSGPIRIFPPTYCLKFLFLIGISYLVTNDRRFADCFSAAMRAVMPLMANTAGFAYFGRSDNTTFGRGLALFSLRLAALLDGSERDECERLWSIQWKALQEVRRTRHGWLRVNNSQAEEESVADRWGRDTYTHHSVYSAAGVCYLLLGEVLARGTGLPAKGEAQRARVAVSRDLGLVRLGRSGPELRASELIVRCSGVVVRGDRRYLGPTLLRWESAGKVIIGAIPRTTEDDVRVVITANGGIRKRKVAYLAHLLRSGVDELRLLSVGYLPFLTRGSYLCAPFRLMKLDADEHTVTGYYGTSRARYRGVEVAAHELLEVITKNLTGRKVGADRTAVLVDEEPEFSRTISFFGDHITVRDSWSRLAGWRRLHVSTRLIRGRGKADVAGLDFAGEWLGWSSDGETTLDLYSKRCTSEQLSYEITVMA